MLISRKDSVLVIVDIQGRILKAMKDKELVEERSLRLVKAAKILDVPVLATEQYPEKLGTTLDSIREAAGGIPTFSKMTFSCLGAEGFSKALADLGRKTVILCGIESHVCVNQTTLDLLSNGYQVVLARDAVSSRFEIDLKTAIKRMNQAGVSIATTEMILFEWLEKAGTPEFKAVQSLIK